MQIQKIESLEDATGFFISQGYCIAEATAEGVRFQNADSFPGGLIGAKSILDVFKEFDLCKKIPSYSAFMMMNGKESDLKGAVYMEECDFILYANNLATQKQVIYN